MVIKAILIALALVGIMFLALVLACFVAVVKAIFNNNKDKE